MGERVTKKDVEARLAVLCGNLGVRVGHYEKVDDELRPIPNGWALDFSTDPRARGVVVEVMASDGTTSVSRPFGSRRRTKREMLEFLEAVQTGVMLERYGVAQ